MNKNSLKEAAAVKRWNENHFIGERVSVLVDDRSTIQTITKSDAWLMRGHSAMILVDGIVGAYSLGRVKPLKPI